MKPLRLTADTNVLLDLVAGTESVVDALAVIDQRLPEADKLVVPSVLDELAFLCDSGQTARLRKSAHDALRLLRSPGWFRPLLELPFSADLAQDVATELRTRDLLPAEEIHDALILAETALLNCGLLLSSDEHLCGVDHELLTLVLNNFGKMRRLPKG